MHSLVVAVVVVDLKLVGVEDVVEGLDANLVRVRVRASPASRCFEEVEEMDRGVGMHRSA